MTADLTWYLDVDWNDDGSYDAANEGSYMRNLSLRRGRQFIFKDDYSGFQPVMVGEFTATLDNESGRYNPYNTSSPLYPNILPGKYARLRVSVAGGATYTLMSGRINDILPLQGEEPLVTIQVIDGSQYLQRNVSGTLQENISVTDAIDALLTAASWPALWGSTLDTGLDFMRYWWIDSERQVWTDLCDLADLALGQFFIAADGKAKFYSRHHSFTPVATVDESYFLKDIQLPRPWYTVRNVIKITARPRERQATSVLWELLDTPGIPAGGSLTIWAPYSYLGYSVAALGVISPVATTDYLMNTATDGTGTNLTSDFTVTATKFATTAKLVFANTGGVSGYIFHAQIRGDAIAVQDATAIAEDLTSQAKYGLRTFSYKSDWLQNTNFASDLATYLKSRFNTPPAMPTMFIDGRPATQFAADLFDHVNVTITPLGVSGEFQVAYIEHSWLQDNGNEVLTKWTLEPAAPASANVWVFPTSIGVTSTFAF